MRGDSVSRIAKDLSLRPQSVRRHLGAIYDETCTWSQAQLVGWAVARGFVSVAELQAVYCQGDRAARRQAVAEPV